jgi:MraZ protein
MMFSGEYFCKLDEKGRFLLPSPVRDLLAGDGQATAKSVVFLKVAETASLRVYPHVEWENVLRQTRAKLDEEQSRLFMHFVVSETSTSEVDKAGRILIPGKLRKHINLDDDQEIVLVGMYEHLEVWSPSEWRRYLVRTQERHEASMSKIMDLL